MVKAIKGPAAIYARTDDLIPIGANIEKLFADHRTGVFFPAHFIRLLRALWMDQYLISIRFFEHVPLLDTEMLNSNGGVHGKGNDGPGNYMQVQCCDANRQQH